MLRSEPTIADALRRHWPEYLMEAAELGLFMVSACLFGVLLFHPDAPAVRAIESELARRVLIGLAMGLTAVALIYSPMGQRSGAHMNPAVTLTFWRLGRIATADAVWYVLSQFAGAMLGVFVVALAAGMFIEHPAVNHVITVPGSSPTGAITAWLAEFTISFLLMLTVLVTGNRRSLAHFTPLFAGALIATYIALESPLSGMSMNPARTFGSAFWAKVWTGLWVYFTAPPLAMLTAAEVYRRMAGARRVFCAKLHHCNGRRCIFRCDFDRLIQQDLSPAGAATTGVSASPPIPVSRSETR